MSVNDTVGRDVPINANLRREALTEAATVAADHATRDEETNVVVTVCDVTGAVCLKVRLLSQVEGP